jgi:hypothetical protein
MKAKSMWLECKEGEWAWGFHPSWKKTVETINPYGFAKTREQAIADLIDYWKEEEDAPSPYEWWVARINGTTPLLNLSPQALKKLAAQMAESLCNSVKAAPSLVHIDPPAQEAEEHLQPALIRPLQLLLEKAIPALRATEKKHFGALPLFDELEFFFIGPCRLSEREIWMEHMIGSRRTGVA